MAQLNLNEDCILNVLENLSENPKHLYNCIQINHEWSKVGVSVLWRYYPWKNTFYSKKFWKPISHTILLSLPLGIKELIILKDITKTYIMNNNPMYNYTSYCRILSQNLIHKIASGILNENNYNSFNQNFLIEELWKLFLNNLKKIDYFILPNNLSLITLYDDDKYITNFQSIVKLECSTRITPDIYKQLSKITNDITELIIYIYFDYPNYDNNGLAKLISSQKNLRSIKFVSYDYEKNSTLNNLSESLKSCSNTLNSIEFKEEDISSLIINPSLINLKRLIIDLGKENTFISQNLISINSIELSSLEVLEITLFQINLFDSFISLLKQTKSKLKRIRIETNYIKEDEFILNYISTLIEYCPLIEDLNLWVTNEELEILELLLISCTKLKQIQLETRLNYHEKDEILEAKPFFELLSTKGVNNLKEINLIGKWNFNNEEFENFLLTFDEENDDGLKIGFHCVNEDEKEKFENTCQVFKEKGILKKYEFNYR
ncbi:hypothetical protein RclHR1_03060016 [Rhizophagus clarus]|uniref:F-box domain-containing protein n=1 Tax=Rhizophagus clarus TaxID=94130 RepID=A0A2Z6RKT4_9GLOM|nr:hypothetical protein RclHR1_03060016 [Rhizophagus clarus]GES79713.1 hypothetical protein GLOIN_2v1762002 [Rhizophagus clarus]